MNSLTNKGSPDDDDPFTMDDLLTLEAAHGDKDDEFTGSTNVPVLVQKKTRKPLTSIQKEEKNRYDRERRAAKKIVLTEDEKLEKKRKTQDEKNRKKQKKRLELTTDELTTFHNKNNIQYTNWRDKIKENNPDKYANYLDTKRTANQKYFAKLSSEKKLDRSKKRSERNKTKKASKIISSLATADLDDIIESLKGGTKRYRRTKKRI